MLFLWAVFIMGPSGTAMPVHHMRPVLWRTEDSCRAEMAHLLETKAIVINDDAYRLECLAVPDLSGEPA